MTGKIDNPKDHWHGHYENAQVFAFVWLVALTILLVVGWLTTGESFDDRDRRLDRVECRLSNDELTCLRRELED